MEKTHFTLGHDLGAVGRWSRILLGALAVSWAASVSIQQGVVLQSALYECAPLAWTGAIDEMCEDDPG